MPGELALLRSLSLSLFFPDFEMKKAYFLLCTENTFCPTPDRILHGQAEAGGDRGEVEGGGKRAIKI